MICLSLLCICLNFVLSDAFDANYSVLHMHIFKLINTVDRVDIHFFPNPQGLEVVKFHIPTHPFTTSARP